MADKNSYAQRVLEAVRKRNNGEPEFLQAVDFCGAGLEVVGVGVVGDAAAPELELQVHGIGREWCIGKAAEPVRGPVDRGIPRRSGKA